MKRYQCPCCGALYNGRRCRECFYEPFTEEISHGLHTHEGEPLVISEPVPKTGHRNITSQRRGCGAYSGRRKKTESKWFWPIFAVLIVIVTQRMLSGTMSGSVRNTPDLTVPDFAFQLEEPEPETMPQPEDSRWETVLYDKGGVQVMADWRDGDPGSDMIPIYVRNDSKRDIYITSRRESINGYMAGSSFIFCEVDAGQEATSFVSVSDFDLMRGNIETIAELSFYLEVIDSYELTAIDEGQQITLYAGVDADFVQPVDDSGTLIYQWPGVKVTYTGWEGESCEDGILCFRIENATEHFIQVFTPEVYVNGELSDLYLCGELTPGARCDSEIWLYPLSDMGMEDIRDITSLEIVVIIWDVDSDDFWTQSDRISVDIFE